MTNLLLDLVPEFFVVILGAALHHGYERVARYSEQKKFERLHPLSGDYVTKYDDESGGARVTVTAPANLVQKGRQVKGVTNFGGRAWVLDGTVTEDGYYLGRYFAENKYDRGTGNFFLKIDANGDLDGMWSGYDSANKIITSGRYVFKKTRPIEIRAATREFLPRLMNIAERELGDSYIHQEDLLPDSGVTFIGLIDKNPVGFAACHTEAAENYLGARPKIAAERVGALKTSEVIGVISTVAVDDKFQGYGIGTKLVSECLKWLRDRNVHLVVMIGWKSVRGVHIGGVAEKLGFELQFEIPDYWSEDSVEHRYKCPVCGDPPCHCTAAVLFKHL